MCGFIETFAREYISIYYKLTLNKAFMSIYFIVFVVFVSFLSVDMFWYNS